MSQQALQFPITVLELCTGGGGQALGLEMAGFDCVGAIDNDLHACETLRQNRPNWSVRHSDIEEISGAAFRGVDLLAAGVPCPPFSIAGKQLGAGDERDLFPEALRIIEESQPAAIMLENVAGFASAKFSDYRTDLFRKLDRLGYKAEWQMLNASDYGVPQLRPRFVLVGLKPKYFNNFEWPLPTLPGATVGTTLQDLMAENSWPGALKWVGRANNIAPTIVGGSKKTRWPRFGSNTRQRTMETFGCRRTRYRGRCARPAFSNPWFAALDCAYGRKTPKFSRRMEIQRPQNSSVPASGQCIPAVSCEVRRHVDPLGPSGTKIAICCRSIVAAL